MKGLESMTIVGLILLVLVILLAFLIVFYPSQAFGQTTQEKRDFEEFCVFWSLTGYREEISVEYNNQEYSVLDYCSIALKKVATKADLDNCRKCCTKEIVC